MKTISITIEDTLLGDLDRRLKKAHLRGRSDAIRQAIRDWLKKQTLQKKIRKEIAAYRKTPVTTDEFGPLIASQEFPS